MQIGFLNFYSGVMSARQERSNLIASNIANVDTPGYKAKDVDFNQVLDDSLKAEHSGSDISANDGEYFRASTTEGLNGNDVSLDNERIEYIQNAGEMQASATFLKQNTSDLITALRPNPSGN